MHMLSLSMNINQENIENIIKKIYNCREKDAKYLSRNIPQECFNLIFFTDNPEQLSIIKHIWKLRWLLLVASLPDDERKIKAIQIIAKNLTTYKFRHVQRLCEQLRKETIVIKPEKIKTSISLKKRVNKQKLDAIAKVYGIENINFKDRKEKVRHIFMQLLSEDEKAAKLFYISFFDLLFPLVELPIENITVLTGKSILNFIERKTKQNKEV